MQRKATKNTRGPNADEKKFQGWLKNRFCEWCSNPGPSIVDHCRGATFKHNKVLIGHILCLPQCVECDTQKTIHGKRLGNESARCLMLINKFKVATRIEFPAEAIQAIEDWNK